MALVLSIREGGDFYIGEFQYVVTKILSPSSFLLLDVEDNYEFEITGERNQEIMRDVFVSAGVYDIMDMARVVIDAPRDILVLRGDKKRAGVPVAKFPHSEGLTPEKRRA